MRDVSQWSDRRIVGTFYLPVFPPRPPQHRNYCIKHHREQELKSRPHTDCLITHWCRCSQIHTCMSPQSEDLNDLYDFSPSEQEQPCLLKTPVYLQYFYCFAAEQAESPCTVQWLQDYSTFWCCLPVEIIDCCDCYLAADLVPGGCFG